MPAKTASPMETPWMAPPVIPASISSLQQHYETLQLDGNFGFRSNEPAETMNGYGSVESVTESTNIKMERSYKMEVAPSQLPSIGEVLHTNVTESHWPAVYSPTNPNAQYVSAPSHYTMGIADDYGKCGWADWSGGYQMDGVQYYEYPANGYYDEPVAYGEEFGFAVEAQQPTGSPPNPSYVYSPAASDLYVPTSSAASPPFSSTATPILNEFFINPPAFPATTSKTPSAVTPKPKAKIASRPTNQPPKQKKKITQNCHANARCSNCATTETTLWRRSGNGDVECNACNLYFRKNNRRRPIKLQKRGIMRRARNPRQPMDSPEDLGGVYCLDSLPDV